MANYIVLIIYVAPIIIVVMEYKNVFRYEKTNLAKQL